MNCNEILRAKGRRAALGAKFLAAAALVGLVASAGLAGAGEFHPQNDRPDKVHLFRRVLFYVPNRVVDFVDIWRLNAGVGLGAGINLRPTKGLQVGFAAYDSVRFGLRGRRFPFWHEWSLEGGFDGMYLELGETERGFYEFGGTIHLLLIGLDGAVDIEEALDFGYGVFLSDPADDDFR